LRGKIVIETLLIGLGIVMGGLAFGLFALEWLQQKARSGARFDAKNRVGSTSKNGSKGNYMTNLLMKTPLKAFIVRATQQKTKADFERELPACLEVVALGMQAGMGFD
jgi:hypothetical protein